jgi:group I intron endonuclease
MNSSKFRGRRHRSKLHRAMHEYGEHAFDYCVLDQVSREELNDTEKRLIAQFHANDAEHGYNLTVGGTGIWTIARAERQFTIWTGARKAKQSEMFSGERNPFFAKSHTEETRLRWSQTRKGTPSPTKGRSVSQETRGKIASSLLGNVPWNKGKKATKDARRNQSKAHIGKPWSAKMRAAWDAKHPNPSAAALRQRAWKAKKKAELEARSKAA